MAKIIPQLEEIKYLGMHFDRRLEWRKDIWTETTTTILADSWHSQLSLESNFLIYKVMRSIKLKVNKGQ